jgi:hypothetical protein
VRRSESPVLRLLRNRTCQRPIPRMCDSLVLKSHKRSAESELDESTFG